jgi:tetratricopeptide (TPR) repeat protein
VVRRSVTNPLSPVCIATLVLCHTLMTAFPAQSETGAEAMARYDANVTKRQELLAKQGEAQATGNGDLFRSLTGEIKTLRQETRDSLVDAQGAFQAEFAESKSLDVAMEHIRATRLLGDHDLAGEIAQSLIDDGAERADLWREYGSCLLTMGVKKEQQGVDALYKSLALDKMSADALATWNELSTYYLKNSMPQAATTTVAAALAINPADVRARLAQVVLHVFDGNIAEAGKGLVEVGRDAQPYDFVLRSQLRIALADFDTHRRIFSDNPENHFAYAKVLYYAGRSPQAILVGNRAASLAKNNTEMWNFLGQVQGQSGDFPGAQRSYENSLKADSTQSNIQQAVEQLKKLQEQQAKQAAPLSGQGPLR